MAEKKLLEVILRLPHCGLQESRDKGCKRETEGMPHSLPANVRNGQLLEETFIQVIVEGTRR